MSNLVVLRRRMVEIGRLMYDKGLIVAAEGNLSVRSGGHSFLVTPAGVGKGSLRVQDLLEVGVAGKSPAGLATSEWGVHREIYCRRPDVGAICHAHPPWATAFAVVGRDLDGSLLTETARFLPRVPVAERSLPGSDAVAESIVPLIGNHDAILLGGHGVVAVGNGLEDAFALLETVERLAQVTLLAEMADGKCCLPEGAARSLLEK
ncbi:MAG: class II aldolase/adducin family protein [Gemmatimonadales bacterium]|nr:class II aldolase/adducin family protein [Gemmatimonadales bacterium]